METRFKKYIAPLIIAIILLSNLAFGLTRLGNYSSVDEPYWTYGRITKFWNGIKAHNWKSTNINDKPGISVALLSGTGLIKMDPMPYKTLRGDVKTETELRDINAINFYFRLPIYLFCIIVLPFFYILLKKLFDETTALLAFAFIGLSPILLGISLIINPDSLLWLFLPLSLLSYFVFQKNKERQYLYISGLLLGAALLTKYVANILYVFFFFLPFLDYIFSQEKPAIAAYLKKSLKDYAIIVAISMLTFFIFYPATWVNPNLLLKGTFLSKAFESTWPLFVGFLLIVMADIYLFKSTLTTKTLDFFSRNRKILLQIVSAFFLLSIAFVLINTYSGMGILDSNGALASPKGVGQGSRIFLYTDRIVADIYSLIFAISPFVLLSLISGFILCFKKKWQDSYEVKIVFYLTLFILFYYLASTVNNVVATVRYQITLYPLAFIIAAIGLAHVLTLEKMKKYFSVYVAYVFIVIISLASLFSVKPFYFAYTSPLLPQKYFVNQKDMGDGSFEAAAYLNNLSHPEQLTVWSDKGAVCAVFRGKCIIGFSDKRVKGVNFDYIVVSSGRKSRSLKLSGSANSGIDFKKAYATSDTAYTITIGRRPNNYVKVIERAKLEK